MKIPLFIISLMVSGIALGQTDAAELAKKLANPVASLISLPFQNNSDHGIGKLKGSRNTLNIQPVIPLSLNKKWNLIARWVQPIVTQYNITGVAERQSGLADAVTTAFLSPKESKNGITWGAGPALLIPVGTHELLTAKKFGIGPSFVGLKQNNGWTYGMLINQLWSVAGSSSRPDISQMFVQPFLTYNWKSGAGITMAAEWTENWKGNSSNVWLVPTFSGLTQFGKKQKVSFAVGPRFNIIAQEAVRANFGVRAAIVMLFPK